MKIIIHTDYGWFQVYEHGSWDVLASSSFTEEGVETVVSTSYSFVRGHLTIRLDAMLQAVQLPAGVTNLDSSLSNVDRNTLTLYKKQKASISIHASTLVKFSIITQKIISYIWQTRWLFNSEWFNEYCSWKYIERNELNENTGINLQMAEWRYESRHVNVTFFFYTFV